LAVIKAVKTLFLETNMNEQKSHILSTTVIGVVKDGKAALGSDGQVTFGNTVLKSNAKKVRKLYNGQVLAGFAGSTSDALTLFEKFESKLEQYRLEAMLAVVNTETALLVSGNGDVIEPEGKIVSIGSGGPYALAAARGMLISDKHTAREIVESSLKIAGEICIYTNTTLTIEELA
jgi:ATP-dependent HslUV protease subunit HslV